MFVAKVDAMETSVDKAMNSWKGDAATAASERAIAHKLHSNHLATTIIGIADPLQKPMALNSVTDGPLW
ncbi:hypothetical protein VMT65_29080 [Nocardia sp. CDC153]|uniref:hypothetical protein n=1 Tax=Nocardia sp. CDC153 TaxID=3112167 RepID=UPI002DBF3821|nr:hypothetical protein [Nocardia sp. CDC153]MEC3957120.1 hypothetical protein [Nocardia sp. CDC153]